MAKKKSELLLLKSIESVGIVGDVIRVRPGFARNYLLPMQLAEKPTAKKIEGLKVERAKAMEELAQVRKQREALLERMQGLAIAIVRSCNDQGVLYGSVTQRDVADALIEAGYEVPVRAVRLNQSIGRVGDYHVLVQFEKDLKTDVAVKIQPDRVLEELMSAPEPSEAEAAPAEATEEADTQEAAADAKPRGKGKGKKKGGEPEADAEPAKAAKDAKPAKGKKAKAEAKGWA